MFALDSLLQTLLCLCLTLRRLLENTVLPSSSFKLLPIRHCNTFPSNFWKPSIWRWWTKCTAEEFVKDIYAMPFVFIVESCNHRTSFLDPWACWNNLSLSGNQPLICIWSWFTTDSISFVSTFAMNCCTLTLQFHNCNTELLRVLRGAPINEAGGRWWVSNELAM